MLHEQVFQVPHYLAAIRSVDEAVVIGVALSLSSSAFVLQLLTERGELTTKFGSATLGILLAQVSATCHMTRTLKLITHWRVLTAACWMMLLDASCAYRAT